MNRNKQIIRVLKILYHLLTTKKGVTIRGFSELFEVHPKTIRRDLKALSGSYFSLVSYQKDHDKYFTVREKLVGVDLAN
ncbi:MAG: HTH domain-containing protein [Deltaproteobacteria bacterium]|nr:HTH domain-containing protein [Deltaproteobacteria bacterium]